MPLLHASISLLLLLLFRRHAQAVAVPQPDIKPSDTDTLTIFQAMADVHGNLRANWSSPDACMGLWRGVGCTAGRVTSLSLPSLDLRGPIQPLSQLRHLRLLDLHDNRLNGTLLTLLPALPDLKLIYLSRNELSGPIPASLGLLHRLLRLDLSANSLSGPIPAAALSNLTRLLTLRLQDNLLTGPLPDLSSALPRLADFNASNNQLYGRVPDGMRARFGADSFAGNAELCGPKPPLPLCSSPDAPRTTATVVPSNPMPNASASSVTLGPVDRGSASGGRRGLSVTAMIAIAVGDAAFLLLAVSSLLLVYYYSLSEIQRQGGGQKEEGEEEEDTTEEGAARQSGESNEYDYEGWAAAAEEQHKLVFFEQEEELKLEELLQASAEMVGKGRLGTVYRAVLGDGRVVAVKRLRDANPCPRKDFARYMDIIGRLRHPNLVPLRAYYYAKEEKLLIYDYFPNGSLYSLLHGTSTKKRRSGARKEWRWRAGVVLGAARGLACIHSEYDSSIIPHGNIRSSNVLLDRDSTARLSDFGLALLLNPSQATAAAMLGGYMAPEQAESRALSQEADVYAFGVLILEALTGRLPSGAQQHRYCPAAALNLPDWVRSVGAGEVLDAQLRSLQGGEEEEEEMLAMLHVALACVAHQPDRRPTMSHVVKMIQKIVVIEDQEEDKEEVNMDEAA